MGVLTGSGQKVTRLLLSHRRALHAYIYAIVRDPHRTEDVFQNVSITLLEKWQNVDEIRDFWALAREIARRQCLAELRRSRRGPRLLSEEALDAVDRGYDEVKDEADDRVVALSNCIKSLPKRWHSIVRFRYWDKKSTEDIAAELSSTRNSIAVTLNRIRSKLADCVRMSLGLGAS